MASTPLLIQQDSSTEPGVVSESSSSLRVAGGAMAGLLSLAAVFFRVPALSASSLASELFRWFLALGMLAAYLSGYRLLRALSDVSGQRRTIVGFAAVFVVLALLVEPFHDIDLCCYINIGWQQAHYGLNPYFYCAT